jgi:hypothetical protein
MPLGSMCSSYNVAGTSSGSSVATTATRAYPTCLHLPLPVPAPALLALGFMCHWQLANFNSLLALAVCAVIDPVLVSCSSLMY